MQNNHFLLFRSGAENCAVALSSVREIARHSVLGSVDPDSGAGRVNARGKIVEVVVPSGGSVESPAICVVTELEDGGLCAFAADEILGLRAERGEARLLVGPRPQSAA